jgi:hypothetical protein
MSDRVAEAYLETTGTASSSGDNTAVAAPGTGRRIVWRKIKLVNTAANAMTVIVKYGATSKKKSVFPADIGAGEIYYEEEGGRAAGKHGAGAQPLCGQRHQL